MVSLRNRRTDLNLIIVNFIAKVKEKLIPKTNLINSRFATVDGMIDVTSVGCREHGLVLIIFGIIYVSISYVMTQALF